MQVKILVVGAFQANCCIAWDESKRALIIDPGADARRILAFVEKRRLSIAAYMLTHGHIDHISAITELYGAMPAPVGIHGADLEWAFDVGNQMQPFYSAPERAPEITRLLEDGQEWTDGNLFYRVISTPGHTPGSVCFFFPRQKVLFSGDTLFAGSVGRADLNGGDSRALTASLRRIARLRGDTAVYPGHGPHTSIAHEMQSNFFMQSL